MFEQSAHSPMFEEPEKTLQIMDSPGERLADGNSLDWRKVQ